MTSYTPPHFGEKAGAAASRGRGGMHGMMPLLPPSPWAVIGTTRWWHLDRAPAELWVPPCCLEPSAQTESVPSTLVRRWASFVRRWASFSQAPAVAELQACAISLCLSGSPPAQRDTELHGRPVDVEAYSISWSSRMRSCP
jgi:hypothetical protein